MLIYDVAFSAETDNLSAKITKLKEEVDNALKADPSGLDPALNAIKTQGKAAAQFLQTALQKATSIDGVSLNRFNTELRKSGVEAAQLAEYLSQAGMTKNLDMLTTTLATADGKLTVFNDHLKEMYRVLSQSVKFRAAMKLQDFLVNQAQAAVQWTKDMNQGLTDIQVVSQKTGAEMEKVFDNVIKKTKELQTTAKEYSRAALIYYQQGLPDAEVERRADITTKAARAAGEDTETMSKNLTAIWNTYQMQGDRLQNAASIAAKLGSETAVNFAYIAEAMQTSAVAASQMGLSYENLAAIISTVGETTMQSSSIVGNAFKTIISRFDQLKSSGTDGEVTLGRISEQLAELGIDILDSAGELKSMDRIIYETGESWTQFSQKQQIAIAELVGGTRQYASALALFNNWDKFLVNAGIAFGETGAETLEAQFAIASKSLQVYAAEAAEAWQQAFAGIASEGALKSFYSGLKFIGESVDTIIKSLGGLPGILLLIGAAFTKNILQKAEAGFNSLQSFRAAGDRASQANVSRSIGQQLLFGDQLMSSQNANIEAAKQRKDAASVARLSTDKRTTERKFSVEALKLNEQLNESIRKGTEFQREAAQAEQDRFSRLQDSATQSDRDLSALNLTAEKLSTTMKKSADKELTGLASQITPDLISKPNQADEERIIADIQSRFAAFPIKLDLEKDESFIDYINRVTNELVDLKQVADEIGNATLEADKGMRDTAEDIATQKNKIAQLNSEASTKQAELQKMQAEMERLVEVRNLKQPRKSPDYKKIADEADKLQSEIAVIRESVEKSREELDKLDIASDGYAETLISAREVVERVTKESEDTGRPFTKIEDSFFVDDKAIQGLQEFSDTAVSKFKETAKAAKELKGDIDNIGTALSEANIGQLPTFNWTEAVGGATQFTSALNLGINSLSNLVTEFQRGEVSLSTFTRAFAGIGSAVGIGIKGFKTFKESMKAYTIIQQAKTIATELDSAANAKNVISEELVKAAKAHGITVTEGMTNAQLKEAISTKGLTTAKVAETAAVKANTVAWYANPIFLVAAAVVAAIGVFLIFNKLLKAHREAVYAAAEASQKQLDTIKETTNSLKDNTAAIEENVKALEEAKSSGEGTAEAYDKLLTSMEEMETTLRDTRIDSTTTAMDLLGESAMNQAKAVAMATGNWTEYFNILSEGQGKLDMALGKQARDTANLQTSAGLEKLSEGKGSIGGNSFVKFIQDPWDSSGEVAEALAIMREYTDIFTVYASMDSNIERTVSFTINGETPEEFISNYEQALEAVSKMRSRPIEEVVANNYLKEIEEELSAAKEYYDAAKQAVDEAATLMNSAAKAMMPDMQDVATYEDMLNYQVEFLLYATQIGTEMGMSIEQASEHAQKFINTVLPGISAVNDRIETIMNNQPRMETMAANSEGLFALPTVNNSLELFKLKQSLGRQIEELVFSLNEEEYAAFLQLKLDPDMTVEDIQNKIDSFIAMKLELAVDVKLNAETAIENANKLQSAIEAAIGAMDDDGLISADAAFALLQADESYVRFLTKVGDQYALNKDAAREYNQSLIDEKSALDDLIDSLTNIVPSLQDETAELDYLSRKLKDSSQPVSELASTVRDLNIEFSKNGDLTTYANEVQRLMTHFSLAHVETSVEGMTEFNKVIEEVATGLGKGVEQLNQAYESGAISLVTYQKNILSYSKALQSTTKRELDAAKATARKMKADGESTEQIDAKIKSLDRETKAYEEQITALEGYSAVNEIFANIWDESGTNFYGMEIGEIGSDQLRSSLSQMQTEVQSWSDELFEAVADTFEGVQRDMLTDMRENQLEFQGMSEADLANYEATAIGIAQSAQAGVLTTSQAIGGLLSELAKVIEGFNYTLKADGNFGGSIDFVPYTAEAPKFTTTNILGIEIPTGVSLGRYGVRVSGGLNGRASITGDGSGMGDFTNALKTVGNSLTNTTVASRDNPNTGGDDTPATADDFSGYGGGKGGGGKGGGGGSEPKEQASLIKTNAENRLEYLNNVTDLYGKLEFVGTKEIARLEREAALQKEIAETVAIRVSETEAIRNEALAALDEYGIEISMDESGFTYITNLEEVVAKYGNTNEALGEVVDKYMSAEQDFIDARSQLMDAQVAQLDKMLQAALAINKQTITFQERAIKIAEAWQSTYIRGARILTDAAGNLFGEMSLIDDDYYSGASRLLNMYFKKDQAMMSNYINNVAEYAKMWEKIQENNQYAASVGWDFATEDEFGNKTAADRQQILDEMHEVQDGLIQTLNDMYAKNQEVWATFNQILDQWNDHLDVIYKKFDGMKSVLGSMLDIAKMAGTQMFTPEQRKTLLTMQKTQLAVNKEQLSAAKQRMDLDQENLAKQKAAVEEFIAGRDRTYGGISDDEFARQLQHMNDMTRKMEDNLQKSTDEYWSTFKGSVEDAWNYYESYGEEIIYKMKYNLASGAGFAGSAAEGSWSFLGQMLGFRNEELDRVMNPGAQMRQASELLRELEKIDTDQIETMEIYNDLMQDLLDAKNMDVELTEYDYQILQERFNLVKAQAAFEDARAAKNTMRLARDASGNWSYIYSADPDDTDDKAKDIEDSLNRIYELSYDRIRELVNELYGLPDELANALSQLDPNDPKYEEQSLKIKEYYTERANWLTSQIDKAEMNSANILNLVVQSKVTDLEYLQTIQNQGKLTVEDLFGTELGWLISSEEGNQHLRDVIEETVSDQIDNWNELQDNIKDCFEAAGEDINTFADDWSDKARQIGEDAQKVGQQFTDTSIAMKNAIETMIEQERAWASDFAIQASSIVSSIKSIIDEILRLEGIMNGVEVDASTGNMYDNNRDYAKEIGQMIEKVRIEQGLGTSEDALNYIRKDGVLNAKLDQLIAERDAKIDKGGYDWGKTSNIIDLIDSGKVGWDNDMNNWVYWDKTTGKRVAISHEDFKKMTESSWRPSWWYNAVGGVGGGKASLMYGTGGFVPGASSSQGDVVPAMLTPHEYVLNPRDTQEFFKAFQAFLALPNFQSDLTEMQRGDKTLEQMIQIYADFPNVSSRDEIQAALNNLINQAKQYNV